MAAAREHPSSRPEYARIRLAFGRSAHFRELPAASLDRLAAAAVLRQVTNGTIVHRSNQPVDALWLVLEGGLRISWPMPDGHAVPLCVIGEGGFFSVGTLVEGALDWTESTAVGDTTVAAVDGHELRRIEAIDEDLRHFVPKLLLGIIRAAASLFADVISAPLPQRLARRLLSQCLASGHSASRIEIEVRISQTDLARMLDASRSNVNTELRRLEAAGIVRLGYRRLFIRDSHRLLELAGPHVPPL